MNDLIIKGVLALAVVAALAFGVHRFLAYEQNIGYQRAVAEYTVKEKAALDAALEKERFLRKQVTEAEHEATKQRAENAKQVATAAAAADGLRGTIAHLRQRLPATTHAACIATAGATASLLDQCQRDYQEMAGIADGHRIDVETLMKAWPQ